MSVSQSHVDQQGRGRRRSETQVYGLLRSHSYHLQAVQELRPGHPWGHESVNSPVCQELLITFGKRARNELCQAKQSS
jgi:hypothetical protein